MSALYNLRPARFEGMMRAYNARGDIEAQWDL